MHRVAVLSHSPEDRMRLCRQLGDHLARMGYFPCLEAPEELEDFYYTMRASPPDGVVLAMDGVAGLNAVEHLRRLKEEGGELPSLIIADGGRGQMESIRAIVADELGLDIPIAGLAKDSRHRTRELLYGFPPAAVGMKPDGPLFRLLTRMQDEVHRFAISFHRDKRSKRQTASELDALPGVGEKRKQALLRAFGSVKRVKEADEGALRDVLGAATGSRVFKILHETGETSE